jgi:GR25 family glycosyltransferase involved in LPS biosynthesis
MKYTIIKVDERSSINVKNIKYVLKKYQHIDNIDYIDGRKIDAFKILDNYKISYTKWNPKDKRKYKKMLKTEAATWVSNINIYKYIVNNDIEELLVLEDDIVLKENFVLNFLKCRKELPSKYDFLSLFYFSSQNDTDKDVDLKLRLVQKSNNQYSAYQGMLFSNSGAKKILKYLEDYGIFYTNDCQIYELVRMGILNGYSIKQNNLIEHDTSIDSIIDPNKIRI